MEKNLKGKRILVSGGGGGSAAYWCKYLVEQGAHVLVNDVGYVQDESMGGDYNINLRTHESADNVVKAIRDAGGIAEADYEDVSEMNGAAHAVEHCLDVFGIKIILYNNIPFLCGQVNTFIQTGDTGGIQQNIHAAQGHEGPGHRDHFHLQGHHD